MFAWGCGFDADLREAYNDEVSITVQTRRASANLLDSDNFLDPTWGNWFEQPSTTTCEHNTYNKHVE